MDVALINNPYEQDEEHHATISVLKTKEYFIYEHIYITDCLKSLINSDIESVR